jgi:hypothetical protein
MNIPRFTAEASLYQTNVRYRPAGARGCRHGAQTIIPQLFIDPFRIVRAIGSGLCRIACQADYAGCLDTCEGTVDNPKPSLNCVLCDQRHASCLQICGTPGFPL